MGLTDANSKNPLKQVGGCERAGSGGRREQGPGGGAGLGSRRQQSLPARAPSPPLHATSSPPKVLDLLGETVECARYSQWLLYPPGAAPFPVVADRDEYIAAITRQAGPQVGGRRGDGQGSGLAAGGAVTGACRPGGLPEALIPFPPAAAPPGRGAVPRARARDGAAAARRRAVPRRRAARRPGHHPHGGALLRARAAEPGPRGQPADGEPGRRGGGLLLAAGCWLLAAG
jgi:hypothetical protein